MATNPATVSVGRAERGPPAIGSGEATVTLADRYEIYPGKRLPAFDAPGTLAYHALDNNAPRSELFALVCNPNAPMRLGALRIMRKLNSDWFVTPLHWGAVHWPEVERRCPVIVFERPSGAPLLSSLDAVIAPLDEKALTTTIIEPVVRALGVLSDTGINHRGLQPCNIFYRKKVGTEIIFGECVSTPPGMGQTMVFETIEGAMTDPVARGPGDQSDDIYALGVTVLTMLMGRRPGAGIDDSAMIVSKIEEGSYAALIGDFQPPGAMATLLRGLLADDRKQRWTLSELKKWLKGARPEPRSAEREPRTDRPFVFEGKKYRTCRSLAYGLACNPAAAAKLAETGTIENWVQNQIRDADRTKALAEARKIPVSGGTANRAADHLLAARVIAVLDPLGPIRYKRLAINIEGFGPALALAMTDKSAVGAMIEIVLGDLPNFWASQQKLNHHRYVTVADSLDSPQIGPARAGPGLRDRAVPVSAQSYAPVQESANRSRLRLDSGRAADGSGAGGEANRPGAEACRPAYRGLRRCPDQRPRQGRRHVPRRGARRGPPGRRHDPIARSLAAGGTHPGVARAGRLVGQPNGAGHLRIL